MKILATEHLAAQPADKASPIGVEILLRHQGRCCVIS
jgi:hypothetical protein